MDKREKVGGFQESNRSAAIRGINGLYADRRESWRGNAVMRNPADDKIIIKIEGDGHWVYCSCREMAMMERSSILFNAVDD